MTETKHQTGAAPPLQVLERAFRILDVFSREVPALTTTELARATHLPLPTVHRIVVVLHANGYLTREEGTKRFRLGTAALDLGQRARAGLALVRVARPHLEGLVAEIDETALLVVPDLRRFVGVCIERVESSATLRLSVEPGTRLPLHAGASQTAILAFCSDDEIEGALDTWGADERRPQETKDLWTRLHHIRETGLATSIEETDVGTWGIAVPLLDSSQRPVASLGLAAPSARLSDTIVAPSVAALHNAATLVAHEAGYSTSRIAADDAADRLSVTRRR